MGRPFFGYLLLWLVTSEGAHPPLGLALCCAKVEPVFSSRCGRLNRLRNCLGFSPPIVVLPVIHDPPAHSFLLRHRFLPIFQLLLLLDALHDVLQTDQVPVFSLGNLGFRLKHAGEGISTLLRLNQSLLTLREHLAEVVFGLLAGPRSFWGALRVRKARARFSTCRVALR